MTPVEILKAARELISVPERWAQREYALAADGIHTSPVSVDARCWCASGAIIRCNPRPGSLEVLKARDLLNKEIGVGTLTSFNDTHTHAEVLDLFDRAIAAASTVTEPQP